MIEERKPSQSSKAARLNKSDYKPKGKKKIYVIDTNVIINDPNFHRKIKDGQIIVPTTVLFELDNLKHGDTELSRNIREFARFLDRDKKKIIFHESENYKGSNDEKIIWSAKKLENSKTCVTLITNDILMGVIANARDIATKKHESIGIVNDIAYRGIENLSDSKEIEKSRPRHPHEYVVRPDGLYRWCPDNDLVRLGKDIKIWGIKHKNVEQKCAIDALMNDDIKLVTLSGKAGTGKTLIALAAGLEKVIGNNQYHKMIVSRPVVPMGQDIGYLPGTLEEKLSPWMQPIFDNIDFLFNVDGRSRVSNNWMELERQGLLKLEALTYIRGRSIPNQFIIIDEAQNLSKHEVKTIISRAGDNTKIILTGDPEQIDNPKLDAFNNGLSYAIEKFKSQKIAAHIHLSKCERSELADIASEIL